MKKTTSIYKVKITPIENREDHFHLELKIGSTVIDAVLERSTIRHIIEIIDNGISTGLSGETTWLLEDGKTNKEAFK